MRLAETFFVSENGDINKFTVLENGDFIIVYRGTELVIKDDDFDRFEQVFSSTRFLRGQLRYDMQDED